MESELKVRGVSHIAVCVADLERSLGFYRDILGLEVKMHAVQEMGQRPGAQESPGRWPMYTSTTLNLPSRTWC